MVSPVRFAETILLIIGGQGKTKKLGEPKQMNAYIDAYAYKNPDMKILEIGAGTGGATFLVLDTLIHQGEQEAGAPRFGHYEFTDISAAFFEKAKDLFKAHADRMSFRVLHIEADPLK